MTAITETTDAEYRERARRLALMLKLRPERHNQSVWGGAKPDNECGTAACVAGWSAILTDGLASIDADGTLTWDPDRMVRDDDTLTLWGAGPNAVIWRVEHAGRNYLGLSDDLADALFNGSNDERETVELLARIGDGRVDRFADLIDDGESLTDMLHRLLTD